MKIWLVILSKHRYFPCCLHRIHSGSLHVSVCLDRLGLYSALVFVCLFTYTVHVRTHVCTSGCNATTMNHLYWWHGTLIVCLYIAGLFPYLKGFLRSPQHFSDSIPWSSFHSCIYLSSLLYCFDSLSPGLFCFNERVILLLC